MGYGPSGADSQDTAAICRNGHVVTSVLSFHGPVGKFCERCGAEILVRCPACDHAIDVNSGSLAFGEKWPRPQFCRECSAAYPWTVAAMEAARELTGELDKLETEEQAQLAAAIPDLLADGPRTALAIARTKRLLAKAGTVATDSMRTVLVDVLSRVVERQVFGGP